MARETGGLCLGHYGHKGCHALIVVKTKMKIFGAHNISIVLYIGVHATFSGENILLCICLGLFIRDINLP